MDLKHYIGSRLRAARHRLGLTQDELAERVDKAVETISNIERGHTYTGLETLERLTETLDISVSSLFEGFPTDRTVGHERVGLETRLRDALSNLDDAELRILLDLSDSLTRNRAN